MPTLFRIVTFTSTISSSEDMRLPSSCPLNVTRTSNWSVVRRRSP